MNQLSPEVQEEISFIDTIIKQFGPRPPGSEAESRTADYLVQDFSQIGGKPAQTETFRFAPLASIASIPVLGYALLFVAVPLYFFAPIACMIWLLFLLFFAIMQIFRYTGVFDFLYPKATGKNVFTYQDPPTGDVKYTIFLTAHMDSSWNWNLAMKNPLRMWIKVPYGIISGVILLVLALVQELGNRGLISWWSPWFHLLLLPLLPGFYFLSRYLSWGRDGASPGALDNLSGIAVTRYIYHYLLTHQDHWPTGVRIGLVVFGAEEASLKGSTAFYQQHHLDLLQHTWILNLDSIGDWDQFHVIDGDIWLGANYDNVVCDMAQKSMQEEGVLPADRIKNPVGGTDAASFAKRDPSIRVATLIAQNPIATDYYHTRNDLVDRLDPRALEKMYAVLLRLIGKIATFENSPQE
jgi:hypothetical protein